MFPIVKARPRLHRYARSIKVVLMQKGSVGPNGGLILGILADYSSVHTSDRVLPKSVFTG